MGNTANAHIDAQQWPELDLNSAKEYDYILCVDQSGSMGEASLRMEGRTRWNEAEEFTEGLARFAETVDDDGLTVIKFNSTAKTYDGVKADAVKDLFTKNSPGGSTNLAAALEAAFTKKFSTNKKAIIFVLTDGIPDSQTAVEKSIINAANKLEDSSQINLVFVQIGDDPSAAKFLDHLDNELTGKAKYDIVNSMDRTQAESLTMAQLMYQAVNH